MMLSDGKPSEKLYHRRKFPLKNFEICDILNPSRKGIVDVWNAFMVEGADFSTNNHDIPFSPTTATFLP